MRPNRGRLISEFPEKTHLQYNLYKYNLNLVWLTRIELVTMNQDPWGLDNAELLQQIGTLIWTTTGDADVSQHLAKVRVGYELYQRLSGRREMEALRNQTILNISKWIQDHPKASKEEISREVGNQILQFAEQVEKM